MVVQDLVRHINNLLWLMIILNFSDGLQCVLTGVLQVALLSCNMKAYRPSPCMICFLDMYIVEEDYA